MLNIRNIRLGSGIPKICVPLTFASLENLSGEAMLAKASGCDLVEWRADYFNAVFDDASLCSAISELRGILGETPILFTLRTIPEGGKREVASADYTRVNSVAIASGGIDLVDIEASCPNESRRNLIGAAKSANVAAVLSHHNFLSTPTRDEMLEYLNSARNLGCVIPKLAVQANSFADTLSLLCVSDQFSRENPGCPVITIAMGYFGKISRIAGGLSGSCLTFASLTESTAPGQLAVKDMRELLRLIHMEN